MENVLFPVLKETSDIFNDIFLPLRERKPFPEDKNQYIYFYRYIGLTREEDYYNKITNLFKNLAEFKELYLIFNSGIEAPFNPEITEKVNSYFKMKGSQSFVPDEIADGLQSAGLFQISKDFTQNEKIKEAFREVLKLYESYERSLNLSIGINFTVKILCWAYQHLPAVYNSWTNLYNPKVVFYGNIKKHEALYLIMLSLSGFDVLYINSLKDDVFPLIDKGKKYTCLIEEPVKAEIKQISIPQAANDDIKIQVVLKDSNNIFEDILIKRNKRQDYVQGIKSVYPVYFQRYIGIDGGEDPDLYYNNIFLLDKKLKTSGVSYIKFENSIPMASSEEISTVLSEFQNRNVICDVKNIDTFIKKVLTLKCFPVCPGEDVNKLNIKAFREIITLFVEKEEKVNPSRLQNFTIKLIAWLNRYISQLYKASDGEDNYKLMYYGDIKIHEILLLFYLSKLGADIVFIHSDFKGDYGFLHLDGRQEFSKLTQLKMSKPLEEFPKSEKILRKSTIAFNASQEIQEVIYGSADTGLFKPWQFENGRTVPVCLKTTYDELKLLWKEPSKIRPEFNVLKDVVYVPNLFVKINGVYEDINAYWNDYRFFIEGSNTCSITSVPFTKINYTNQEMYSLTFVLNGNKLLDRDKLFNCKLYKLGYLKNSLQNFIINKINELFQCRIFKREIDDKFKLKIIMTIINMDSSILRLIEKFDFTGDVPKLVIYSNSREGFSQEDIIIIGFLYIVGMDIAIFTPTNYNNIEASIKESIFDVHQLPSVAFDLNIPNLESLKSIFKSQGRKSFISKLLDFKGGNTK